MTDPNTERCALYDENGTDGDPDNPNSTRNAPLNNPNSHLDKIYFHSDFDYCEVGFGPTNVTINHSSVSPGGSPSGVGLNALLVYGTYSASNVLLTHSLGYIPDFMVIADGDIIYGGTPIQYLSDGRTRNVTAYATTSQIILYETAIRTSSTIPALSKTYTIIVFLQPPEASGNVLIDFNPTSGTVEMGKGKFNSSRRYLQIVPGGSPFGFARGRTIDLNKGAPRFVDPDGTITDPVPSYAAMNIAMSGETGSVVYGDSYAYNGSFTGTPGILVQVP